jgi:hypothetical protein
MSMRKLCGLRTATVCSCLAQLVETDVVTAVVEAINSNHLASNHQPFPFPAYLRAGAVFFSSRDRDTRIVSTAPKELKIVQPQVVWAKVLVSQRDLNCLSTKRSILWCRVGG